MEEIDIKELLSFFKKRIFLILTITFLCSVLGALYGLFIQKPEYESYTTIILGSGETTTITQNDISINKSLVSTYTELVKSRRVLSQVISKLNLEYSYDELSKKISVSEVNDAEMIKIVVKDQDAYKAKDIANTAAKYFTNEAINLYQMNNVKIVDYAVDADSPANISIAKQSLIFILVGIVIGCGVVFVMFYFNDTVNNKKNIEEMIKIPVLGRIRNSDDLIKDNELVAYNSPASSIAEDFRMVRTNLQLMSSSTKGNTSILITSSTPHEGKSFIAANLATVLAQSRKKVLLVDTDLRLGRIHEILNIKNDIGFSRLLTEKNKTAFPGYIKRTNISNLWVITRGNAISNSGDLLDMVNLKKIISEIKKDFDYLIIDGNPLESLADSLLFANIIDKTVLVCTNGRTDLKILNESRNALEKVHANIAGMIVNKVEPSRNDRYHNRYYHHNN